MASGAKVATLPRAPYRQLQAGERFARIGDKTGVYEVEGFKVVEDLSLDELELLGKTKYTGLCAVATFLERADWHGSAFYGRAIPGGYRTYTQVAGVTELDSDVWSHGELVEVLDCRDWVTAVVPLHQISNEIIGVFHWLSLKSRRFYVNGGSVES